MFMVLSIILCVVATWFVVEHRIEQARKQRQQHYQAVVTAYSEALKPGLSRKDVERYLQSHHQKFRRMCCISVPRDAWADLIQVGTEKPPWYCNYHNVYVAFEFASLDRHEQTDARDSDRLVGVTLYPWLEECL
jgi:hypothetical protein